MSESLGIGKIITTPQGRDAIHVAVMPAEAADHLEPGAFVGFNGDGKMTELRKPYLGVVDPFLNENVKPGERFWLFLIPGSISTLRHVWTHRDIPDSEASAAKDIEARGRLDEFAKELNVSREEMFEAIENCRHGGDPLYSHSYEGMGVYDGFWRDYETVTGKPDPNKEGRYYFFTCGGCS